MAGHAQYLQNGGGMASLARDRNAGPNRDGHFLMTLFSGRHAMLAAIMAGALALGGCHKAGETTAGAALPEGLAGVRAAIVARNYAQAETLAQDFVRGHPGDAAAQFELARAEALLGNQGKALDALEAAVNAGLPDAAHALDDPAFAALAGDPRLAALREKAAPRSAQADAGPGTTLNAGSGADAVSIHEDAGGTHIQAGDVKLDTDY